MFYKKDTFCLVRLWLIGGESHRGDRWHLGEPLTFFNIPLNNLEYLFVVGIAQKTGTFEYYFNENIPKSLASKVDVNTIIIEYEARVRKEVYPQLSMIGT